MKCPIAGGGPYIPVSRPVALYDVIHCRPPLYDQYHKRLIIVHWGHLTTEPLIIAGNNKALQMAVHQSEPLEPPVSLLATILHHPLIVVSTIQLLRLRRRFQARLTSHDINIF
jgi:hypothetical protein